MGLYSHRRPRGLDRMIQGETTFQARLKTNNIENQTHWNIENPKHCQAKHIEQLKTNNMKTKHIEHQ